MDSSFALQANNESYLLQLATTMIDKFNKYEPLNKTMNQLQIAAVYLIKLNETLSQETLDMLNVFIKKYTDAKEQYDIAKKVYESEMIAIANETAEAKRRLEASKRPRRIFLPLLNGTFGVYGLPSESPFCVNWYP